MRLAESVLQRGIPNNQGVLARVVLALYLQSQMLDENTKRQLGIGQPRVNPPAIDEMKRPLLPNNPPRIDSYQEFIPDDPYTSESLTNPVAPDWMKRGPVTSEPLDPELVERAIEYFGTTKRPLEAGYIMPRGQLLDLSGRHHATGYENKRPIAGQPDYLANQRGVDHRELGELVPKRMTEGMVDFIDKSGAIRYDARSNSYDGIREPTLEQKQFMKKRIDDMQGSASVDMYISPRKYNAEKGTMEFDESGRMAQVYPLGTPTVKIMSDINRFFRKKK